MEHEPTVTAPPAGLTTLVERWCDNNLATLRRLVDPLSAEQRNAAARAMLRLHHALAELAPYVDLIDSMESGGSNDELWFWEPLFETRSVRLGLLYMKDGEPIPLHDHPGSSGFLLALRGPLVTEQYDLGATAGGPGHECPDIAYVTLCQLQQLPLAPGEGSFFTDGRANVHSLAPVDKGALVLDLIVNPYDHSERNWYFPVAGKSGPRREVLAQRWRPVPRRRLSARRYGGGQGPGPHISVSTT